MVQLEGRWEGREASSGTAQAAATRSRAVVVTDPPWCSPPPPPHVSLTLFLSLNALKPPHYSPHAPFTFPATPSFVFLLLHLPCCSEPQRLPSVASGVRIVGAFSPLRASPSASSGASPSLALALAGVAVAAYPFADSIESANAIEVGVELLPPPPPLLYSLSCILNRYRHAGARWQSPIFGPLSPSGVTRPATGGGGSNSSSSRKRIAPPLEAEKLRPATAP